jgi:AcrR family transcriptional regulator
LTRKAQPKPKPSADRRGALREALAEAAERRVAAAGSASLRARDLAADVGCALGAIYLVFADLDAIVAAVNDRTLQSLERQAAAVDAGKTRADARGSAVQSLQALAALYLRFALQNRNLWRALFDHRGSPEASSAAPTRLDAIFAHIERQLRTLAPSTPSDKRGALARALFGAVHGIVALGLDGVLTPLSQAEVAWQVEAIVDLAAKGMAGG